jgi:hypothetical protein
MKKEIQTITIVKSIAILMLLWALADNPYGYYQILRWVVCGVAGYSAYLSFQKKEVAWVWVFGISAALFNPIEPIHLTREIWSVLNIIVAGVFSVSIFIYFQNHQKS